MLAIIYLIIAFLIAMVIHEYAHYRALRSDKIPVIEAGLGLGLWPVLRIPYRGVTWTLSPWLLGAYVKPSAADFEKMEKSTPYHNLAWHYGAGVWANFVLAFGAFMAASLLSGHYLRSAVWAALAVALWVFRRGFAAYVQPALAPLALASLIYGLALSWSQGKTGLGFAGTDAMVTTSGSPAFQIVSTIGTASLVVAVINLLPFFPMDNGRTISHLLNRWFGPRVNNAFRAVGLALVVASLVGAVLSDAWAIAT